MQVLTSHTTAEWYTPPVYVDMARKVMGSIDLDPASNDLAQSWVKAGTYYTQAQDGLKRPWFGNVWLNPPYGKMNGKSGPSCQDVWSDKLEHEYVEGNVAQAILLINSTHGYKWYENLWTRWPVCLVRDRIRFMKPDGTQGDQAKRGQTFVYFGTNHHRFHEVFQPLGRVLFPWGGGL